MNPRTNPRKVPDNNRYWAVELSTFGRIDFRLPYYADAVELLEYVGEATSDSDSDGLTLKQIIELLPSMGAVIGRCWYCVDKDLDAVFDDDLGAFGREVADELQDQGLDLHTIVAVFNVVVRELSDRLLPIEGAQEVRDFSAAPQAPSTS